MIAFVQMILWLLADFYCLAALAFRPRQSLRADNVSARQQLARGYYELGDDAQARVEFEELRKLNPPAEVVAAIDRLSFLKIRSA